MHTSTETPKEENTELMAESLQEDLEQISYVVSVLLTSSCTERCQAQWELTVRLDALRLMLGWLASTPEPL